MFVFFIGLVLVSSLLACAIALFSATVLKRALPSIVLAYLLSLALFVGNGLLFLIDEIYHIGVLPEAAIAFLSPLIGYIYLLAEMTRSSSVHRYWYWFGNCLLFLIVAAFFYALSWLIFKRYRMCD